MRVIAGTARSMPLKTPKKDDIRPTTDRIKETLFNMLQPYVADSIFIDVYSGSGGIGIEALSRGARHAYFIDNDTDSIKCITSNLEFTKFTDKATVLKHEAFGALSMIREEHADVIFADPPYSAGYEETLLMTLKRMPYVDEDTVIIVEAELSTDFSFAKDCGFDIMKEKCYKSNKHVWLTRCTQ